jgi:hypothetical protein
MFQARATNELNEHNDFRLWSSIFTKRLMKGRQNEADSFLEPFLFFFGISFISSWFFDRFDFVGRMEGATPKLSLDERQIYSSSLSQ